MSTKMTASTGRKGARRALCVGINDHPYEGNDLNGCSLEVRCMTGPDRPSRGIRKLAMFGAGGRILQG